MDKKEIIVEFPSDYGFQIAAMVGSQNPEFAAATGASLSRDPRSLKELFTDMTPKKKERIIGKYFRRYGHSSVGEMGDLFLSVEGVSMLGACSTISFPRFRGQEASTRYIVWNVDDFLLPTSMRKSKEAVNIVKALFEIYEEVRDCTAKHFIEQGMTKEAAKPKALDIAAAFLPVAAKTNVVITCDIRNVIEQAWNLQSMLNNEEAQAIGDHLLKVTDQLCPNSIKQRTKKELKDAHALREALKNPLLKHPAPIQTMTSYRFFDVEAFKEFAPLIATSRLKVEEVGARVRGTIGGFFSTSFRSLREFYRHRVFAKDWNLVQPARFTQWYFNQLPEKARVTIEKKVRECIERAEALAVPESDLLYTLPMGCAVNVIKSGGINAWLYFLRLRSGKTVHPEVRSIVHELITDFSKEMEIEESVFGDMDEVDYVLRTKDA